MIYTGVFAIMYVAAPGVLMLGHATGINAEEFAAIRGLAIVLLRFVAAYCFFDALQIVFVGAIKGAGDTWFVLGNTTVVSSCAVFTGWIGTRYFEGGLLWWWFVVAGWVIALSVTYLARFLQGYWQDMRVIESDMTDALVPTDAR
jgi:MATE family multidrug resistance protein